VEGIHDVLIRGSVPEFAWRTGNLTQRT